LAVARPPLSGAFEVLEHYPALAESRDRVLSLLPDGSRDAIVALVRADVGLAAATMRVAADRLGPGAVASVAEAVATLDAGELDALARRTPVFGFFQRPSAEQAGPVRFALHALGVQRVMARLAEDRPHDEREELLTAALLHDIGKLALGRAVRGYDEGVRGGPLTPEEGLARERRELGMDHATIGGEILRRFGLAESLVQAIEGHHEEDARGQAALVRLADMLAHYQHGEPIDALQAHKVALAVGLGRDALGALMYELAYPLTSPPGPEEPCPLTARELDVLRQLASGKVYKQAAAALGVTVSTVRNHAHNAYRKLGVADRAQAVMLASERGWL
jgi:putative nucleotidyltransferase with HDIG domain